MSAEDPNPDTFRDAAPDAPIDDKDSEEQGSSKEPRSSKEWLGAIADAEKAFHTYQEKADNIDKLYAELERLASTTRDRQFQLFWANISVLGPSVYSRPPVPVVTPRFRDRRPIPRVASELLERSTIVGFESADIDGVMRLVRDDMLMQSRGQVWLRYEADGKGDAVKEKVCIDHADRRDFLHEAARNWQEVGWVAKRSWLTRKEMRKRFSKPSGAAYQKADYAIRKDAESEADDGKRKAGVWEIWSKTENKVIWVTKGVEVVLDEDEPHLTLEGFFPCPRPAYASMQRRSLIPVPDILFYKDQLEEINELTARIAALSEAVKVRGFYPAGAAELGDAIESAIKKTTDNQVLIGISNWAMIGGGGAKDMIVWLPIDLITTTITNLVVLRKQLIDDVYQITGISDIMRGQTEASETLGAQQLKSQYGSVRIRDRQEELVRFARDVTRISAEIMAENFQPKSLLEMSQMELPSDADIAQQIGQMQAEMAAGQAQLEALQKDIEAAQADPEVQQMAQAAPDKAKQIVAQVQQQIKQLTGQIEGLQQQIEKTQKIVTIDQVMALLREQKLRPFVLDIETDSTIAPDENAAKQRATEFMTAVGGILQQALGLLQQAPEAAPLVAEAIKYTASQYRAGREMEGVIDEFADKMAARASAPKPPDPAHAKAQADAQAAQIKAQQDAQAAQVEHAERLAEAQRVAVEAQNSALEAQTKAQQDELDLRVREQEAMDESAKRQSELAAKQSLADYELTARQQKHEQDLEIGALQIVKLEVEIEGVKAKNTAQIGAAAAKVMDSAAATLPQPGPIPS